MGDGAQYLAIGIVELRIFMKQLGCNDDVNVDPIPFCLKIYTYFEYGNGKHANDPRVILESVPIAAYADSGLQILSNSWYLKVLVNG